VVTHPFLEPGLLGTAGGAEREAQGGWSLEGRSGPPPVGRVNSVLRASLNSADANLDTPQRVRLDAGDALRVSAGN
jgi:hypothetical protein